ncbi:hypothetical protein J6590_038731 [Homalodisca vitripennis]|nr:hypothetical protein J6590_038731 [Homalodisca vitripennis]
MHVCRRECHQVGDRYVRACFTNWVSNRVSPHVISVTTMWPTVLELVDAQNVIKSEIDMCELVSQSGSIHVSTHQVTTMWPTAELVDARLSQRMSSSGDRYVRACFTNWVSNRAHLT